MLYKYRRVNHQVDRYHSWVKHLVLDVWCKASSPFSSSFLLPDFEAVVNAMPAHYLLDSITEIHNTLIHKPKSFKRILHDGFRKNNSIEAICSGEVVPIHYSSIKALDNEFANKLYRFCVKLYELLSKDDTRIKRVLGGINSHYKTFFKKGNNANVCPFCCITKLLGEHHSWREAYDHFFPKEIYPFNTVNFENLVPMCGTCNSKYKKRKDPANLRYGGPQKLVFYPFSTKTTNIEITLTFNKSDIQNLKPEDVDISITSDNCNDQVIRWKELFGIEERYKASCCEEAAHKGWLEEYQIFSQISPINFKSYIATKESNRFLNEKFLEIAYLKACKKSGLI